MYESQLDLFEQDQTSNIANEIKRQVRIALSKSNLSRDQVADEMNLLAVRDGVNGGRYNRATLDGWCKDSDASRVPGLAGLVLFCRVLGTVEPVRALLRPLGADAITQEDRALLSWARAERDRRKATRRARLAAEILEM